MGALSYVRRLLPAASDYALVPRTWKVDLLSGLTVGIVALPLALGFGVSSGAGPEAGLVTAIIAGVVAAIFGGSNVQVSGPTGAMVVVLAPIIATRGTGVLGIICLMAGLLVVLGGVFKIGRAVGMIPWPVIEGFTLGIAATIFLQQVPNAVGVSAHGLSSNAAVAAVQAVGAAHWPVALWELAIVAAVALIMVFTTRVPVIPGSIIAIIIVSLLAIVTGIPATPLGQLPVGFPAPSLPTADWSTIGSLVAPAATVAVLAAIESLLSARVASSLDDVGGYDADRELVGQGLASIAAGFFGGMPATGAIARTAVNVRSGAKTRLSAMAHSIVLLVIVIFAAAVVARIPLAALSGVLMVTAFRMVNGRTMKAVVGASRSDAMIFIVTAIITVSVDLIYAVGIGILLAALVALWNISRLSGVHRLPMPEPRAPGDERIAIFSFEGSLFFGAAERILDQVAGVKGVSMVVLRLSQVRILDATGAQFLTELVTGLERRGVTVLIKGVQDRHLALVQKVGVLDALRHENHLFDSMDAAVAHARSHVARELAGTPTPLRAAQQPH